MCKHPAMAAYMAAHEVIALRELRQRCVAAGVHSMAGVNAVLEQMLSERALLIGRGHPDSACDAYEQALEDRTSPELSHA